MDVTATLARALFVSGVVEKILESFEQERAEASPVWIRAFKQMAFKKHDKKILGKVLCVRNGVTVATNEGKDGSPVNLAELTERVARGLRAGTAVRAGKHEAPACGSKTRRKVFGRSAGVHERELWYLRIC